MLAYFRRCLVLFVIILGCAALSGVAGNYLSPTSLAIDSQGKQLYVACATSDQVIIFDTESEKSIATLPVKEPRVVLLSPDNSRLYVSAGTVGGAIHEFEIKSLKLVRSFPAGHTPESMAISADGKTLYYCNRFSRSDQNDVLALNLSNGKVRHSAKAIREPATATLTKDGKRLWVANHLPLMAGNEEHVYAEVNVYDSGNLKPVATLNFPAGSYAIYDAALSADGKYIFYTHSVGRFTVPTTHLDRGWINTSGVSIFDTESQKYVNTVLLDDTVRGAPNPWGIDVTPDGKWLCVTISGTHELMVVDLAAMFEKLAAAPDPSEVVNDLGFLYGIKTRVEYEGLGPRAVVTSGERVYTGMYFSDNLNIIDMWEDGPGAALDFELVENKSEPNDVRSGEIRFFDATLCYQNWLSCGSCHPGTRSDGTNWDLMNDGIGNPKQSRSLLYTHRTSPVMITGIRASADIAVGKGFELIQFHALPQEQLDTVSAYLKSLEPVPSPYLNDNGTLTAAAKRGKKIFEGKAGCVKCHTPPYHADKKKYVLGLGSDDERNREFATPILIELWRTAPYMYDGRAVSLQEVVTSDNSNGKHGNTKGLSAKEVEDLVWYLNSL